MRAAPLALVALLAIARPAAAVPIGLTPLGGDWETARMIGKGHWAVSLRGWMPQFDSVTGLSTSSQQVLQRWQMLPAWPRVIGLYGLSDENEAVVELGPDVGGAYRRFFMRAVAPWGGEYLQALLQLGGGFNLASEKPYGYIRFPALYERGPWTLHVAPGGYYLFNDQPMVDVNLGLEFRPIEALQFGVHTRLRMDAKQLTPTAGTWAYGAGVRWQLNDDWAIEADAERDPGPPAGASTPNPVIEFADTSYSAGITYYHW